MSDSLTARMAPATVYEIAARAGVSIATVSRVINDAAGIRPATRARVLQAIEDLAYVPNGSAQGMARRSTGVLGLIYRRRRLDRESLGSDDDDALARLTERTAQSLVYYDELIRGVEEAAFQCAHMVLLRGARTDAETPALLSMTGKCDGLVLVDRVIPDADMGRITRQVPVASIAHFVDAPGITNVSVDNQAAMHALVDHMVERHGARRFAFLGGPADNTDSNLRAAAMAARVAMHGGTLEPLADWQGDYTPTLAYDIVVRRCADRTVLPDVIMSANDSSAMGAIAGLAALGLSVPGDVAVTGFDDMELASLSIPPLTTVRQPINRMAQLAVEALAGGKDGQSKPPANHLVPADMVVRRSCGCR
ncbi:LacI family DNA-binding transcriptional regulator [Polymorphobacter sp.]|uniref:LacI family DNA-binding transcriptional regulator n=1 Tax=Polymorphobacter sp. TaxID=1909290 RepID=UPI003F6ED5B9